MPVIGHLWAAATSAARLQQNILPPSPLPSEFNTQGDSIDWDDAGVNLALIIVLSSSLGALTIALLVIGIYFICLYTTGTGQSSLFLALNFSASGQFADEEALRQEEELLLPLLPKADQLYYKRGKSFEELYPPSTTKMGKEITAIQQQQIDDRGLDAFHFEQDANEPLAPNYAVDERTDILFTSNNPSSAMLNFPLPIKSRERDTIYFEVKLFELPGYDPSQSNNNNAAAGDDGIADRSKLENSVVPVFDIGLVSKPYPNFRLPGYNKYSVSYENNGKVRINRPFDNAPEILPKLAEGDVIGVGFRPATGSVFFTRNGKKLYDIIHGMKLNLYPAIGAQNCQGYRFQVNLGQLGFVFIEANVKKWGLAKNYGTLGAPPAYGVEEEEEYTLIAKGDPIPPSYPSQEDFFGHLSKKKSIADETTPLLIDTNATNTSYTNNTNNTNHNRNSSNDAASITPVLKPPSYSSADESLVVAAAFKDKELRNEEEAQERHQTPDSHVDLRLRLYEQRSTEYGYEDTVDFDKKESAVAAANVPSGNLYGHYHNHYIDGNNEGTSAQLVLKNRNTYSKPQSQLIYNSKGSGAGSVSKAGSLNAQKVDVLKNNGTAQQKETTLGPELQSNGTGNNVARSSLDSIDPISKSSRSRSEENAAITTILNAAVSSTPSLSGDSITNTASTDLSEIFKSKSKSPSPRTGSSRRSKNSKKPKRKGRKGKKKLKLGTTF